MTGEKMLGVLADLADFYGVRPRGVWIDCSSGCELRLQFASQPAQDTRRYLLAKGFVSQEDGSYVYRPRR